MMIIFEVEKKVPTKSYLLEVGYFIIYHETLKKTQQQ